MDAMRERGDMLRAVARESAAKDVGKVLNNDERGSQFFFMTGKSCLVDIQWFERHDICKPKVLTTK